MEEIKILTATLLGAGTAKDKINRLLKKGALLKSTEYDVEGGGCGWFILKFDTSKQK